MAVLIEDEFGEDRQPGEAIGSLSPGGDRRGGADVESRISVDHGGLRIAQLTDPGWGRAALAYGPYHPRPGLAAAVHITNGHNSSENTDRWPGIGRWGIQWIRGTQSDAPLNRLGRRRAHPSRVSLADQVRAVRHHHAIPDGHTFDENLAVGWFSEETPDDPARDGHGFVMRALGPENGRLEVRHGDRLAALVRGVQNIPMHYVVVLRERGSILYVASLEGARGMPASPTFRPIAIDETPHAAECWAGVHQSVLGQVGWVVDTRVHDVRVVDIEPTPAWFTSALAADRQLGQPLSGAEADVGGSWVKTADGSTILTPPQSVGLLHATFGPEPGPRVVTWRHDGERTGWFFTIDGTETKAEIRHDGKTVRTITAAANPGTGWARTVQILDDGFTVRITVDGLTAIHLTDADAVLPPADGGSPLASNGFGLTWDSVVAQSIEGHPQAVSLPAELVGAESWQHAGQTVIVDDDFAVSESERGQDLATRSVGNGDRWERTVGPLPYRLDGDGALVDADAVPWSTPGRLQDKLASIARPAGRRTAYTLPWSHPEYADIATRIVPPGQNQGEGQEGRGGLLLWQDPDNLLILNTWLEDTYGGASVSSFFRINGFEELYDAVWTNVGERIRWGREYELRMASDGDHYLVHLDGEPVLHRRLTDVYPAISPLKINRVGIITNWEFGDDTGSRFRRFTARV